MSLASDLTIDASKFDPHSVSPDTVKLNEVIQAKSEAAPAWYEIGAARYREMRWNGEGTLPKVNVLESGVNFKIPSRETGRDIPCRFFKPENGQVNGVMMHVHGGGWVLQGECWNDWLLKWMADNCGLAVVSVGYRLAPEHVYPAAYEDCFDAAEWLVRKAKPNYGAELKFIGGESAGAHLSVVTALHLHQTQPSFALRGLVLHYGIYELSNWLPAVHHCDKNLVSDRAQVEHCIKAFLPNYTVEQRRDPWISPFYARLSRGSLPAALFTCGTEDLLVDDSVMMAVKWQMSGNEGVLKIYPGAPHGFTFFPYADAATSLEDTKKFVLSKLE
ncbi:Alpha/Beta hydrolase protein [Phyllosticta capitalensis]|uniref:Alpha/Beta hydrolase protein n=1 Tax=Phyllosticta capitalensis TaxID=121624 RepID=A0ABR1Z3X9_9PEZI